MIYIKQKVITGIILVFGFTGTISITLHLIELLNTWNVESKDIVVGLMSIVGSLIGGILTVLGVALTIRETNKSKEKDELPKKVLHIENTLDILSETIKRLQSNSSSISLSYLLVNKFDVEFRTEFIKISDEYLKRIRRELVYVDSNTYKELLKLVRKIKKLESYITDLQVRMYALSKKVYSRDETPSRNPFLEEEEQKEFDSIFDEARKIDEKISRLLEELFRDFNRVIKKKYKEIIDEIDY